MEIQCPCLCGDDRISPLLIEKLQKARNIVGKPVIITSGVRCEKHNTSLKNLSMNSSHVPNACGIGQVILKLDRGCTNGVQIKAPKVWDRVYEREGGSPLNESVGIGSGYRIEKFMKWKVPLVNGLPQNRVLIC